MSSPVTSVTGLGAYRRTIVAGVLANLGAMPVVSVLVMPAGMFGLAAMPFGFDGVFWWLMGAGIDWMIVVARITSLA
jgi:competence protein ComEC